MISYFKIVFIRTVVFLMIVSCGGFHINSRIDPLLDPAQLEYETGTQTIDLNENGQCPNVTLIVNPENIETRKEKFVVGNDGPIDHYLIPKEFIDNFFSNSQRIAIATCSGCTSRRSGMDWRS